MPGPDVYTEFGSRTITRRAFLARLGVGTIAVIAGGSLFSCSDHTGQPTTSAPEPTTTPSPERLIPVEKNLSQEWVARLTARGEPEIWSGAALETIGMPVGGIGAGQLYLAGDGRLALWEIMNIYKWIGVGHISYPRRVQPIPIENGHALLWRRNGESGAMALRGGQGLDVRFRGEYPIGTVVYTSDNLPLRAELEAFTPFIPLRTSDSANPATFIYVRVTNTSPSPIDVSVAGWMANGVMRHSAERGIPITRRTEVRAQSERASIHFGATVPPEPPRANTRVLQDFEGTDFGDWTVSGKALGTGPMHENFRQWHVVGYQGSKFANSYGDPWTQDAELLSPEFTIDHRFLNFLVGAGNFVESTAVNLLVDGQRVRNAVGQNDETLRWTSWDVSEFQGRTARIQVIDTESRGWGYIMADHFELSDEPRQGLGRPDADSLRDWGSITYRLDAAPMAAEELRPLLAPLASIVPNFVFADVEHPHTADPGSAVMASQWRTLQPGETIEVPFLLAWYFPNFPNGRFYTTLFDSSDDVAKKMSIHRDELARLTRLWRDTWYDSTLPYWLLDRILMSASTLATGTVEYWPNGRFYAWEGVISCEGTCTHVWNYAQAVAWLFPELERSARVMQDFGPGYRQETGLIGFRGDYYYAADGQAAVIIRSYREHRNSPDDAFLRKHWPTIRHATEFLMSQDEDGDGLIETKQHNTFDVDWYGPNGFVGFLFLAALRCAEEMAREMDDTAFADRARARFEAGRKAIDSVVWNGEYYPQIIPPMEPPPANQLGAGCLTDQTFGAHWARVLDLGDLAEPASIRSALQSIWKYNWAPDVGPYNAVHKPFRVYAEPGEAGAFLATWPMEPPPEPEPFFYHSELWTGSEYQAASHMLWEGLITEGLSLIRAVHERYAPAKRNPYNEIEAGDHYARAMASWGALLALSGFRHHGPAGTTAFAPRISPGDFRAPFVASQGWGTFTQRDESSTRRTCRIDVLHGKLRLVEIRLAAPGSVTGVELTIDDKVVRTRHVVKSGELFLSFPETIAISSVVVTIAL